VTVVKLSLGSWWGKYHFFCMFKDRAYSIHILWLIPGESWITGIWENVGTVRSWIEKKEETSLQVRNRVYVYWRICLLSWPYSGFQLAIPGFLRVNSADVRTYISTIRWPSSFFLCPLSVVFCGLEEDNGFYFLFFNSWKSNSEDR
jgi:hypothetical protein